MADLSIDSTDERDEIRGYGRPMVSDPSSILAAEWGDGVLVQKTKDVALPNITPAVPHPNDTLDPSRVSRLDTVDGAKEAISALESDIEQLEEFQKEPSLQFPNLAWEAVVAGLMKEQQTNDKLKEHIDEAQKHQKDIDLLLDLSAELSALKDDQKEMPEKLKDLLGQLKERGIDLWKHENGEISKERISDLKSLSSAQVDKLRSNLQILFTTKIQVLVQSIAAILECVKDAIRNYSRLISTANRLPGH